MGAKHPVVWHHTLGDNKAPVFYCALGHFSHFYNSLGPQHVAAFLRAGLTHCMK
jgi:type 1 glutamine amidotransferase